MSLSTDILRDLIDDADLHGDEDREVLIPAVLVVAVRRIAANLPNGCSLYDATTEGITLCYERYRIHIEDRKTHHIHFTWDEVLIGDHLDDAAIVRWDAAEEEDIRRERKVAAAKERRDKAARKRVRTTSAAKKLAAEKTTYARLKAKFEGVTPMDPDDILHGGQS